MYFGFAEVIFLLARSLEIYKSGLLKRVAWCKQVTALYMWNNLYLLVANLYLWLLITGSTLYKCLVFFLQVTILYRLVLYTSTVLYRWLLYECNFFIQVVNLYRWLICTDVIYQGYCCVQVYTIA